MTLQTIDQREAGVVIERMKLLYHKMKYFTNNIKGCKGCKGSKKHVLLLVAQLNDIKGSSDCYLRPETSGFRLPLSATENSS